MSSDEPLASAVGCGVCGQPLVYGSEEAARVCSLCGIEARALIYCPAGHYVCDACHSRSALDVLRHVLGDKQTLDPVALLERVMAHPSVPMHGPEHHAIVPGVIIAAVRNAGYPVPQDAIDKALERAAKVPGGWCGFYGDCGAAVGVGIAVSVLTGGTPLTGKQRTLALGATSFALGKMLDDHPRCCKRATRLAVSAAVEYLNDHLAIALPESENPRCSYSARNRQCPREQCSFYRGMGCRVL